MAQVAGLAITDLDSGRTIPFEHADLLWQPLLVRDLDSNILLPFAPEDGRSASAEEMLNPPRQSLHFMSCALERSTLPPPLCLPEYRLYKVSAKRKVEMFAACRRVEDTSGLTHFDVRWQDGVLSFTGKLEVLPPSPNPASRHIQELAMYDDYINYYGFPRELGFIRTKALADASESGALIELIIPRVSPSGAAAQFRVNAVPGQSMLSRYKQRARAHVRAARPPLGARAGRVARAAPPRRARPPHRRPAGEARPRRAPRRRVAVEDRLRPPALRLPDVLRAARPAHGAQLNGRAMNVLADRSLPFS